MTVSTETAVPGVAGVSRKRVPDFFVVGHPKCGTTALYEMLRSHPQIYMPPVKEPRFFGSDMHSVPDARAPGGPPRTPEEYLSLFQAARPAQRAGEASPLYLASHTAAAEIAEVQPDASIIAILREPASFLRSLHLQFVQSHLETEKDLREAIAVEGVRRRGKRVPNASRLRPQVLLYSDHVRYVEQLRRYEAAFSRERMLVLVYDDLRRDNEATVRRVLRFLGVDDTSSIDVTEANPTVRVRSQRLDALVHALSVGRGPVSRAAKASVKAVAPQGLRRQALHVTQRRVVFTAPRRPDERLMLELRRRFKGEVVALSEYLGRDLVSLWGYDRIG
jgi:Sulfotransferase family